MPSWVTDEKGLWHPAKEKVGLVNNTDKPFKHPVSGETIAPGEPFIYEGPDRAALYELYLIDKTGKTTTLGANFRENPEFLEYYAKMRNAFGFNTIDAFLTYIGYDEKERKKTFDERSSAIQKHELPKKVAALQAIGGGSDTVYGKTVRFGGWGDVPQN